MSEYVPISDVAMKHYQKETICDQLCEAQEEIVRLSEYDPGRTKPGWVAGWIMRIDALEEETAKLRTDCVPGSIWGHDINEKSSPDGAARFREEHEAKVLERLEALEAPPKDLSDLYPKDGPNVRDANAHAALSEWLMKVDKRLRQVEGGDPTSTVPRWKNVCLGLSERLDTLEESGCCTHDLLEARLTALSETVAKNRREAQDVGEQRTGRVARRQHGGQRMFGPGRRFGPWDRRKP